MNVIYIKNKIFRKTHNIYTHKEWLTTIRGLLLKSDPIKTILFFSWFENPLLFIAGI